MSYELPYRGILTDLLVEHLTNHEAVQEAGIKVGDGVVHPGAGWNGPVGKSAYVAGLIVGTRQAVPGAIDTLAARHASWAVHYGLVVTGGSRTQADHAADVVRNAIATWTLDSVDTPGASWKVRDCHFEALAPVTADQRQTPPVWIVNDDLVFLLQRKRT